MGQGTQVLERAGSQPRGDAAELLRTVALTKNYTTLEGDQIFALDATSVTLSDGEFVSVVGPSGCGKSTLMKLIAGIIPRSGGRSEEHTSELQSH